MIAPHGGKLINRIAGSQQAEHGIREEAKGLRKLTLTSRELNDLALIAIGAVSPLAGFMTREDYEPVVSTMRLANGLPWSIPVVLAVDREEAPTVGTQAALYDGDGELRGVIEVEDVFEHDKLREAKDVYRTEDGSHPGVAALFERKDVLIGGPVWVIPRERDPESLSPIETRAEFERRGWKTIVGFQTRNPVHRAHEYIQKCAMEIVDGLLLHPLVGETKGDDIPAEVRMRCYRTLLENYYPADRVVLSTLPAAMRYAGPREAIFHAMMRKNYGCTHFIVGRDHAGVGSYYGTYDAQKIFEEFDPAELGIMPLKFENSFYCRHCQGMGSKKTCNHDSAEHVALSGTQVRAMLRAGQLPPPEFSRPEVAKILIEASRETASA
ncbi:MAG TPA: sulfate adenylyltransferase [Candidatus Cybelea sp.]|jgi:sulfate adenylyltransferase|nr:sulfate adenylyltransferase [Candidatus Cybelea sp.]